MCFFMQRVIQQATWRNNNNMEIAGSNLLPGETLTILSCIQHAAQYAMLARCASMTLGWQACSTTVSLRPFEAVWQVNLSGC